MRESVNPMYCVDFRASVAPVMGDKIAGCLIEQGVFVGEMINEKSPTLIALHTMPIMTVALPIYNRMK